MGSPYSMNLRRIRIDIYKYIEFIVSELFNLFYINSRSSSYENSFNVERCMRKEDFNKLVLSEMLILEGPSYQNPDLHACCLNRYNAS